MELAEKREVILIPVEFITRLAITTNTKQTFMCVHPPPYIRMVEENVLRLPSKALQRNGLFWHISKEINIHQWKVIYKDLLISKLKCRNMAEKQRLSSIFLEH